MQVAAGESPMPLLLQVAGQLIDDLGAPAALLLAAQDLPPDPPVEFDQLPVDRDRSPRPRRCDPPPDIGKELSVGGGASRLALRRPLDRPGAGLPPRGRST